MVDNEIIIPEQIRHLVWSTSTFKGKEDKMVYYKTAVLSEAQRKSDRNEKFFSTTVCIDVYKYTIRINKIIFVNGRKGFGLLWKGSHREFSNKFQEIKEKCNQWMKDNKTERTNYRFYGWVNPPLTDGSYVIEPYPDKYFDNSNDYGDSWEEFGSMEDFLDFD